MAEDARNAVAVAVAEFMVRYSFELNGYAVEQWIQQWLTCYPSLWVRNAAIEALYQGRYKAISISQILNLWQRRGRPLQHFNREFERIVAGHSLPTWLGESAVSRGAATPEPVLIATDALHPVMASDGSRHSSNRQVLMLPPLQLGSWHAATDESGNRLLYPAQLGNRLARHRLARHRLASSSIQPFQPAETVQLTLPGEIRRVATPLPIQQFIPAADSSELHGKLKAIAQALLLNQAQTVTAVLQTTKSAIQSDSASAVAGTDITGADITGEAIAGTDMADAEQMDEPPPVDGTVEPIPEDSA
jgi:hypothetical protein